MIIFNQIGETTLVAPLFSEDMIKKKNLILIPHESPTANNEGELL